MSANPNPSRVTQAIWGLWTWFDQLEPTVSLGGIFAAKGGYHDIRNGHAGDYSVAEVGTDREGPGDKASALDLTMSAAAMRKYTTRLDVAARARDERLYISGQAVLREFIGTKDSTSVYCYVLVGGRARGLSADASADYGRDSSHLWHLHLSIIRKFAASSDAADRIYSVLGGESLSAWKARRAPTPPNQEDDDMIVQTHAVPQGFAYDADGDLVAPECALSLALPPAGAGAYGGKRLYLSLAGDHADPTDPPQVRVAINNGGGWAVKTVAVPPGKRVNVEVPANTDPQAYNVTLGRVTTEVPDHADLPLSVMAEVG